SWIEKNYPREFHLVGRCFGIVFEFLRNFEPISVFRRHFFAWNIKNDQSCVARIISYLSVRIRKRALEDGVECFLIAAHGQSFEAPIDFPLAINGWQDSGDWIICAAQLDAFRDVALEHFSG